MPNQKNTQPLLDISKMDIETCITIPAIKLKYLSKKQNEYGTNHMFQLMDERQLKQINNLGASNLKMPVWEYEENYYLKINDKKFCNIQWINLTRIMKMELNRLHLRKMYHILWI